MSYNYAPPSAVIAVSVLFPVIGSVAVASRFFTRSQGKSSISIDDWLVVPALIVEWIIAALLIWGAATNSLGVPLPTPNIPGPNAYLFANSDQQIRMSKIQYHVDWLGTIALGLLKASLLLLYRKIFCTTRSVFSILTTTMLVVVVAWTITFTLGLILRCGTDPQAVWGLHIYAAKLCPHSAKLREGYANSDFIIDVLIWFMPIPKVLYKLMAESTQGLSSSTGLVPSHDTASEDCHSVCLSYRNTCHCGVGSAYDFQLHGPWCLGTVHQPRGDLRHRSDVLDHHRSWHRTDRDLFAYPPIFLCQTVPERHSQRNQECCLVALPAFVCKRRFCPWPDQWLSCRI